MALSNASYPRLLLIGAIIIGIGLVSRSDALHELSNAAIVWTDSVSSRAPMLGIAVFVLLAMLSAMVAFFSSTVLVPAAVYAWGDAECLILLWLGWFLGGVASYCIGRYLGRPVAAMVIGNAVIANWESKITQQASFLRVLAFQAVVPSEIPGYVLGLIRYRFLLYIVALAITELPYAIAAVYLGESFLNRQTGVFVALGVAVLLLAGLVWKRARSRPPS